MNRVGVTRQPPYEILEVNLHDRQLLGYSIQDLKGCTIERILGPDTNFPLLYSSIRRSELYHDVQRVETYLYSSQGFKQLYRIYVYVDHLNFSGCILAFQALKPQPVRDFEPSLSYAVFLQRTAQKKPKRCTGTSCPLIVNIDYVRRVRRRLETRERRDSSKASPSKSSSLSNPSRATDISTAPVVPVHPVNPAMDTITAQLQSSQMSSRWMPVCIAESTPGDPPRMPSEQGSTALAPEALGATTYSAKLQPLSVLLLPNDPATATHCQCVLSPLIHPILTIEGYTCGEKRTDSGNIGNDGSGGASNRNGSVSPSSCVLSLEDAIESLWEH